VIDESDVCYSSIRQLHQRFADRSLSPVDVTSAFLDRIAAANDELHAYLTVTAEIALTRARESERRFARRSPLGLLDGIPLALKDVYDTQGIRTTGQSAVFADRVPGSDAAAVERVAARGAVLLGKLALTELGAGVAMPSDVPPPARNPWDVGLSPGGSSSGPAVAVAAGLCVAALGTDAGGSIRDPAACCGVVGLKPTYGLVSRRGCIPLSWSLDTCGPITRTVEDCTILLGAIAGFDPADAGSADVPVPSLNAALEGRSVDRIRIGIPAQLIAAVGELDDEVRDAYDAALAALAGAGAHLEEVELPDMEHEPAVFATILNAEAFAFHRDKALAHPDLYGRSFYQRLVVGSLFTATDYLQALRGRSLICAGMKRTMASVDLLALPTRPRPAQPFGADAGGWARPSLRHPFNVTKQPAVSIPCGWTRGGLPIGLQLVGRWFEESLLLSVARAYEQQHDWVSRRPAVATPPPSDPC
jgi:aspartyl-tRNA(Asn)/glutamyl-tRNA(Gln) amidotransferase subunit A